MERTNIHLSTQQKAALKRLYEETGIKPAEHIRRAIDEYLERQQEKLLRQQQQK